MPSIAIDGPSGAGKSMVSRKVAQALGLIHLDTGAMYRAVGMYMALAGVDLEDVEAIARRAREARVEIRFEDGQQKVILCGRDVTGEVRAYSLASSQVSKVPAVREMLIQTQRKVARERGVVMDGRDIGTVVLPDADLKIFLTADARVRAERRYREIVSGGGQADREEVYRDLLRRDERDMGRAVSPLFKAADAVEVDSTGMTEDEVVSEILRLARRAGI